MNLEKVVFGFFVLLAATLNFGYVTGDIGNPDLHNVAELYAAVVVNIVATILKFGDRTQMGAMHLAPTPKPNNRQEEDEENKDTISLSQYESA